MSPEQRNQPDRDTRQEVLSNASSLLERMRQQIDGQQRQRVIQLIQSEGLSQESLLAVDSLLDRAQQEYARNPAKSIQILNTLIAAGEDGHIAASELQQIRGSGPESEGQISSMVEKMSSMMNGLSEQLGGLGSGTLKMLEGFFGPDSMFGKMFSMLKNSPKAQATFLEKKLLEQDKTLSPGTDIQQVVVALKPQIARGMNIEKRVRPKEAPTYDIVQHKEAPTYDIVQHVEMILATVDPSKKELSPDEFVTAGEKVLVDYAAELQAQPPQAPAAAPAAAAETERVRKPVSPTAETPIATNDATVMKVTKDADGVSFDVVGKKASVKKVGEVSIASAEIMNATPTLPAAVVLTLTDNAKVEIAATELKAAATDQSKKSVSAKNLTTKGDLSIEILFS